MEAEVYAENTAILSWNDILNKKGVYTSPYKSNLVFVNPFPANTPDNIIVLNTNHTDNPIGVANPEICKDYQFIEVINHTYTVKVKC